MSAVLVPKGLVLDLDHINDIGENGGRIEKSKNKTFTYYQNPANIELDKETFSLDGGYENGIEENKSEASKIECKMNKHEAFSNYQATKRKINKFLKKDIEGERQNGENYNLNDLEKPDSIAVQANIVKRSIEIILDIGTTSGIKNLKHYHQHGIEIKKDEHEASKKL
ncbi:hypothetical protein F8M41_010971 [Gigaspora margarita]|uniref:Uncharacterized protein n=1 Tax=Gigaspora margarita TaxID=4874 RepID=A0A8H4AUB2_GIGMA|nr:hypothetical protein F8M41_010971 [Gigaspora margarita]